MWYICMENSKDVTNARFLEPSWLVMPRSRVVPLPIMRSPVQLLVCWGCARAAVVLAGLGTGKEIR